MREEIVFYSSLLILIFAILIILFLSACAIALLHSCLLIRNHRTHRPHQIVLALYAPSNQDFKRFKYFLPCYIKCLIDLQQQDLGTIVLKIYVFSHYEGETSLLAYPGLFSQREILKSQIQFITLRDQRSRFLPSPPSLLHVLSALTQIHVDIFINLSHSKLLTSLMFLLKSCETIDLPYPSLSQPDYKGFPILTTNVKQVPKENIVLILCDQRTVKKAILRGQQLLNAGFLVRILRRASQAEQRKDNEYKPFLLSALDRQRGEGVKNLITLEEYFYCLAQASAMVILLKRLDDSLTQMIEEAKEYNVKLLIETNPRLKQFDLGKDTFIIGVDEDVIMPLQAAMMDSEELITGNGKPEAVETRKIDRYQKFRMSLLERIMESVNRLGN